MLSEERKKNVSVLTSVDKGGLCPVSGVIGDFSRLDGLQTAPRRAKQRLSQVVLRKSDTYTVFVDGALSGVSAELADFCGKETSNELLWNDTKWQSCAGFVDPDSGIALPGPLSISVVVEKGRLPEKVVVRTMQEAVVDGAVQDRVLVSTATMEPSSSDSATFHALAVPFPALFTQPPSVDILDVRPQKRAVAARHSTLMTRVVAAVVREALQYTFMPTMSAAQALFKYVTTGSTSDAVRFGVLQTGFLALTQVFG
jgi:hypothetical protein